MILTQDQARERFMPNIEAYGQTYTKKTKVWVKRAEGGEKIETITSDGKETENVAKPGEYIIQNQTGAKERYIISSDKLLKRYKQVAPEDREGWSEWQAIGQAKGIQYNDSPIEIVASWGEAMPIKPGDMVVTPDGNEIYRIARKEFEETYV